MLSKKILNKTITLFNYLGENSNGEAKYSVTYISKVAIEKTTGTRRQEYSSVADDKAVLFIFDKHSFAYDKYGYPKAYLPYEEWKESNSKEAFWTVREEKKDFWVEGIVRDDEPKKKFNSLRIQRAVHYDEGSKRMHHWEIDGL